MKRATAIAVLLFFLPALCLAGAVAQRLELRAAEPGGPTEIFRVPDPGAVLIELAAPPVLLSDRSAPAAAAITIDALLARLERDLLAIEGEVRLSKGVASSPPRLIHRYRLAFAGASAIVSPESVDRIARLDYVRRVHPDRVSTAWLATSTSVVGAPQFWAAHGVRGQGAVVAVIDSGIDYRHPAFGGRMGPGAKVRGGHDFINGDADPMDDAGHGTHVAGIIAGDGGGLVGVAPDATLLAYKVLDDSGSGPDSAVLAGIERAIQDGAHIINMSLGRATAPDDPVTRTVENASAAGVLFCVAAGNSGKFLDIGTPGNAGAAITVGAIDNAGRVASFSTRGPVVPSGALKPELVAPGVEVVSARMGGGTLTASGTSMAAPHVAGVAALLRSLHPDWDGPRIRAALIGSARPIQAEVMARGAGSVHAVDAAAAIVFTPSNTLPFGIADPSGGVFASALTVAITNASGEARSLSVKVDGLREGIGLVPSASTLTLPPRGQAVLSLSLTLDPTLVPAPAEGSLSFGGSVRLESESGSFSIPWGVVLASRVRVQWTGADMATVRIATAAMNVRGFSEKGRTVDLFIGAGSPSLWLTSGFPYGDTLRSVFRDDIPLGAGAAIALGPADAPHRILFRGTDAEGRPLAERGDLWLRDLAVRHRYFDNSLLDSVTQLFPHQELFVSDLPGETRLIAFERAFEVDPSVTWVALYPSIDEIDGDVTLTLTPEDWSSAPVRALLPANLEQPYQSVLGAIWISTSRGSIGSVAGPNPALHPSEPGRLTQAWITRSHNADAAASIAVDVGGHASLNGGPAIPVPAFLAEFTTAEAGNAAGRSHAPRLSDARFPSGEPIVIGDGPVHPAATIFGRESTIFASVEWLGPVGEQRLLDPGRMRGALYDEQGNLVTEGGAVPPQPFLPQFRLQATVPAPALYRFRATNPSFSVGGVAAEGRWTATFDLRNDDASPPALTSLRLTDGAGRVTSTLARGSSGTFTFSAVDLSSAGLGAVEREKTTIEIRRHGAPAAAPWIPLTAVISGEAFAMPGDFGKLPPGTLYRASLEGLTGEAGSMDVRISVEDAAGNDAVYELEPGFVVQGRWRSVKH